MSVLLCGTAALLLASGAVREQAVARFAGSWAVRAAESEGLVVGEPEVTAVLLAGTGLTIKGNAFGSVFATFATRSEEVGTFAVVGARDDCLRVDVVGVETFLSDTGRPPPRKFRRKELWRWVDGKTFQRCFPDDPAGDRPTAFASKKGGGTLLVTYKRREK